MTKLRQLFILYFLLFNPTSKLFAIGIDFPTKYSINKVSQFEIEYNSPNENIQKKAMEELFLNTQTCTEYNDQKLYFWTLLEVFTEYPNHQFLTVEMAAYIIQKSYNEYLYESPKKRGAKLLNNVMIWAHNQVEWEAPLLLLKRKKTFSDLKLAWALILKRSEMELDNYGKTQWEDSQLMEIINIALEDLKYQGELSHNSINIQKAVMVETIITLAMQWNHEIYGPMIIQKLFENSEDSIISKAIIHSFHNRIDPLINYSSHRSMTSLSLGKLTSIEAIKIEIDEAKTFSTVKYPRDIDLTDVYHDSIQQKNWTKYVKRIIQQTGLHYVLKEYKRFNKRAVSYLEVAQIVGPQKQIKNRPKKVKSDSSPPIKKNNETKKSCLTKTYHFLKKIF